MRASKNRITMVLVFALGGLRFTARGAGDGTFEAPSRIAAVRTVVGLSAGRFDRDGRPGLAAVDGSGVLTVLFPGPDRQSVWQAREIAGAGGFHVRAADFNADGLEDLVVSNPGESASFLLARADGVFAPAARLPGTEHSRWSAAGDFDSDGRLDLAIANHVDLTISLLRGDGNGSFSLIDTLRPSDEPHSIEVLDFDGDRKLDLVVGIPTGFVPLKGAGDGTFSARPLLTGLGGGCHRSVRVADLSGDGLPDLVIACGVLVNRGDGSFLRTVTEDLEIAAIGDFDGDGTLDVSHAGRETFNLLRGKGDGDFLSPLSTPMAQPVSAALAADLDADGRTDLALAHSSTINILWGPSVDWFRKNEDPLAGFGTARTMAVGDLDLDGLPDVWIPDVQRSRVRVYLRPGLRDPAAGQVEILTDSLYSLLELADLDGNGLLDLVGINRGTGMVQAALLLPGGKVLTQVSRPVSGSPAALAIGRLDDGDTLDVVVTATSLSELAVLHGLGGGQLSEPRMFPSIEFPRDLSTGDFDGDGREDVALASTGAAAVHFSEPGGGFSPPVTVSADRTKHHGDLLIADMTGDGREDLLVAGVQSETGLLWRGTGGRGFEAAPPIAVGQSPLVFRAADLNGDGLLDLATTGAPSESLAVCLNRANFTWSTPAQFWIGFVPTGHRLADFDGDGVQDALAYSVSRATILKGREGKPDAPAFLRGDADRDGGLALNDPIIVLASLFLGGGALPCEDAADADDDGVLGLSDPIATLSHLFLGSGPLPRPGPETCGPDPTPDGLAVCLAGCP